MVASLRSRWVAEKRGGERLCQGKMLIRKSANEEKTLFRRWGIVRRADLGRAHMELPQPDRWVGGVKGHGGHCTAPARKGKAGASGRKRVTVEDLDVFLVAPEDLILSKLEWAKDRGEWMRDTPPEIERRFREMLLQRSGEDRLKMGCSMHQFAKMVVRASVLAANPRATPADLRRALFLRFYGRDFDPQTCRKVLLALESGDDRTP